VKAGATRLGFAGLVGLAGLAWLGACGNSEPLDIPVLDGPEAGADSGSTGSDAGHPDGAADATADASSATDASDAAVDKSATCAATFGENLTPAFGRIDGTVVAIVPPGDEACALPNSTHLVIQVMQGGLVYRMVVDVLSNQGSPDVLFEEMDAPLAGEAWAEGWHTDASLDYVTTLSTHSTSFTAMVEDDLVAKITSEIELGSNISIYATATSSEPDSAHLVHRNLTNQDGAIVLGPDTAHPHYLLMHFDEQTF
jgi:hypothetical protein